MEEESSWEVCSEGSSELLSESEESSDEEYRDQVLDITRLLERPYAAIGKTLSLI